MPNGTVSTTGKHKELYSTLLKSFDHLSDAEKKLDYDSLAVANVGPSVVPNPYLPSFRIFSYNITGSRYSPGAVGETNGSGDGQLNHQRHLGDYMDRASLCHDSGALNESWRCKLNDRWHSSPNSPSRTNRLYTPLGFAQVRLFHSLHGPQPPSDALSYSLALPSYLPAVHLQYYMPNLTGTEKHPPKWKLEYLTFAPQALHPPTAQGNETEAQTAKFVYPIPLKHLPRKLRAANVTRSKYAPYGMADLTIPSWAELARRLARAKKGSKLRRRFRQYMYMGANAEL